MAAVEALMAELGALKPNWDSHSLASASQWAADQMRDRHPGLDEASLAALAWTFSWWWR